MTGRRRRASSAPRKSNPPQPSCPKFVEPFDEITPSALAGPGVSSPTARTRSRAVPVRWRMESKASMSAATATAGPSRTRLGVSTRRSTRQPLAGSMTVALFLVPPLSRPTTTQSWLAMRDSTLGSARQKVEDEHGVVRITRAVGEAEGQAGGRRLDGDRPPAREQPGRPDRPRQRGQLEDGVRPVEDVYIDGVAPARRHSPGSRRDGTAAG